MSIQDVNGRRFVLVSLDLLAFHSGFAEDIRRRAGLASDELLINASHTHQGPLVGALPGSLGTLAEGSPDPDYVETVKTQAVKAIDAARSSATAASLYFGTGQSSVGAYRRSDGGASGGLSVLSAYPQRLDVLEARLPSGKVLALAFFFGCHPVSMYGDSRISSDYPGKARDDIEDQLKAEGASNPTALFFQGFGGDINPFLYNQRAWGNSGTDGVSDKNNTGATLARDVTTIRAGSGVMRALLGPLTVLRKTIQLPLNPFVPGWPNFGTYTLPTDLEVLQIGDDASAATSWTLVASSHEVVSEFAGAVRGRWPTAAQPSVTLVGYSNSVASYLATNRMITLDANPPNPPPGIGMTGYEGRGSAQGYYQRIPHWMDSDFTSAVAPIRIQLNDNFNDNTRDTGRWSLGSVQGELVNGRVQVNERNNRLEISPLGSYSGIAYNGYASLTAYDLTGRRVGVSVASAPLHPGEEAVLSLGPDGNNLYRFSVQSSGLYALERIQGVQTAYPVGTFDSSANRYLQIRHDPTMNLIVWESSRDGVLWRTHRTSTARFPVTAARVELIGGTFASVSSPATLAFDNFRLIESATSPSPLNDNFDDNQRGPLWTVNTLSKLNGAEITDPAVVVSETSGQLQVTPRSNVAGVRYNGYVSSGVYDLTGSAVSIRVTQTPNSATSAEMGFGVGVDGDNLCRFNIHDGQYWATDVYGGTPHLSALGAYSTSTYPYLRIRSEARTGSILYEGSADGISWQVLHQSSAHFDVRNVRVELIAGTYSAVSSPGVAKFDDVRFARTSSSLSDTFDGSANAEKWMDWVLSEALRPSDGAYSQPWDMSIAVVQNQMLSISPRSNIASYSYAGYTSTYGDDLRGAGASIDLTQALNPAAGAEIGFSIGPNGKNRYRYSIQGGTIHAQTLVDNSLTDHPLGYYNHSSQRYLRIRHFYRQETTSDGKIQNREKIMWETSPDRISWTCAYGCPYGEANRVDMSAARVEIIAGTYVPVASPGVAVLDDLRVDY